ncbi:hypothetical protein WMY93_016689 [Mugilogobius chulae]|uniref:Uncharacterized protein n=1 Tax=Mugilogobius chulae TaxID=88201 RepID=A0AAW0NX33_9GOBI
MLDTTPLLLPQPSPSPSPSGAPRMGTGAVGRNRAGSKVGPDCLGGGIVLVDGKPSCLPRLVSEISHVSDADMMAMQDRHRAESWSKHNNGSRSSFKNEVKMGSQVKTRPIGRDLEGKVQSGMQVERGPSVHRESHRGKSMDMSARVPKSESIAEFRQPVQPEMEKEICNNESPPPPPSPVVENEISVEIIKQVEDKMVEGSKSHKHKSSKSKSSSRTRPGTATGSRPGVLSRGLRGLESPTPPEGIESTWPRRVMVRKRTVRQGGALHNLPILPPLPSVLSALEKRRPHGQHHLHHSENPLSNITNSGIVGRCSLKEPSHSETGQGISPVGRASLKEQNLESWRVAREQDDSSKSKAEKRAWRKN